VAYIYVNIEMSVFLKLHELHGAPNVKEYKFDYFLFKYLAIAVGSAFSNTNCS
jgi:hypothetical protein